MGFRTGAFATVWSVESVNNAITKGRISISRKNKQTNEYETDFSGFVSFIGTAAASKAARLKERDRIRLGDIDVSNVYDKAKNTTYTNFKIFGFDNADETGDRQSVPDTRSLSDDPTPTDIDDYDDSELPF